MTVCLEIAPSTSETLGLNGGDMFIRHFDVAPGDTVATVLKRLVDVETKLADSFYDPTTGAVTDQVRMILNGFFLDLNGPGLLAPLRDGDRLVVVPGGGD